MEWIGWGFILVVGVFVAIGIASARNRNNPGVRNNFSSSDSSYAGDGGASFWGSNDCGSSGSDSGSCGGSDGGGGGGGD